MKQGFTLLELLLVLAILGVLFALSIANISNVIPSANLEQAIDILRADTREQQMKAMMGYEAITGGASEYGVYFADDHYTIFTGSNFVPGNEENYDIELPAGLIFENVLLPQAVVVFAHGSGDVVNFDPLNHSITIKNTVTQQSVELSINQYGLLEEL